MAVIRHDTTVEGVPTLALFLASVPGSRREPGTEAIPCSQDRGYLVPRTWPENEAMPTTSRRR